MNNSDLDKRKQNILKTLVIDYIDTCEPVASKKLASTYNFNVKSATIRSEMNELSDMGFLLQPHKSAGRIPSDLGYRFYIDNLMEKWQLDNNIIEIVYKTLKNRTEIEMLITSACQILSDMSGFIAIASFPRINDSKLKHIAISKYTSNKLLFVVAFSNGYILHKLVSLNINDKLYSLENAINHLYDLFLEKSVDYISSYISSESSVYEDITNEFTNIIKENYSRADNIRYIYEGMSKVLKYPEFSNLNKLQEMLIALEDINFLNSIFKDTQNDKTTVKIGVEHNIDLMKDYSLVSGTYKILGNRAGVIGILGQTRMDYAVSIASIEVIIYNLSSMLTNLSA